MFRCFNSFNVLPLFVFYRHLSELRPMTIMDAPPGVRNHTMKLLDQVHHRVWTLCYSCRKTRITAQGTDFKLFQTDCEHTYGCLGSNAESKRKEEK